MTLNDYRDKAAKFSGKHGNTLIGTLRSHYGSDLAAGGSESGRLTDVFDQLDEGSLNKLSRECLRTGKFMLQRLASGMPGPKVTPDGEHQSSYCYLLC